MNYFWKNKYRKYRFILKSGANFFVECENISIKWDTSTTNLTSYKIEGVKNTSNFPFHLTIPDISAIIEIRN